jgi:hypothetical protein
LRAAGVDAGEEVGLEHLVHAQAHQQVVHLHAVGHGHARLLDVAAALAQSGMRSMPGSASAARAGRGAAARAPAVVPAEHALLGVAAVAAEELVAAVAGQHALDAVLAGPRGADPAGSAEELPKGWS